LEEKPLPEGPSLPALAAMWMPPVTVPAFPDKPQIDLSRRSANMPAEDVGWPGAEAERGGFSTLEEADDTHGDLLDRDPR
jgi:hypothetical protein